VTKKEMAKAIAEEMGLTQIRAKEPWRIWAM